MTLPLSMQSSNHRGNSAHAAQSLLFQRLGTLLGTYSPESFPSRCKRLPCWP